MKFYLTICQYVQLSNGTLADFDSFNIAFKDKEAAYKRLYVEANSALAEIRDWYGADSSNERVTIDCNLCDLSRNKTITTSVKEATIPDDNIFDYYINTSDNESFWTGRVEEYEVNE